MNYKKDISFNFCKLIVEFAFSTLLILVFTFCIIVILSMKYLEQFIFCRTLQMDLLTGSTSISYLSKVEISFYIEVLNLKVEFKFSNIEFFIITHTRVYSSKIRRQVYTGDRKTRPGLVISLTLERAPLQSFQESKYPRV